MRRLAACELHYLSATMGGIRKIALCILVLCPALGWPGPTTPEQQVAAVLTGTSRAVDSRRNLTEKQLRDAQADTENTMRQQGLLYLTLTASDLKERKVESLAMELIHDRYITRVPNEWSLDTAAVLYEPVTLVKRPAAVARSAWEDERTPALLDELRALGYQVLIDPTLSLSGFGGYHQPKHRTILMRAAEPFSTLVHEAMHVLWLETDMPGFLAKVRANPPAAREALMSDPKHSRFGRARLQQACELADRGYPDQAINEALAVTEQTRTELGVAGRKPDAFVMQRGPAYVARYLVQDLTAAAAKGPLRDQERRAYALGLIMRLAYETKIEDSRPLEQSVVNYLWLLYLNHHDVYQQVIGDLARLKTEGAAAVVLGAPFAPQETEEQKKAVERFAFRLPASIAKTLDFHRASQGCRVVRELARKSIAD